MPELDEETTTDDGAETEDSRLDRIESALADVGARVTEFLRAGTGGAAKADTDTDDDGTGAEDDDEGDDVAADTTNPRSARAVELDVESHVRNAMAKVKREEEQEDRLRHVEEKVNETPPEPKVNRLGKALWGSR